MALARALARALATAVSTRARIAGYALSQLLAQIGESLTSSSVQALWFTISEAGSLPEC
jgi:hypothetical protein